MIGYAYLTLVLAAAVRDARSLKIPKPLTVGLAGLFVAVALLNPLAVSWLSHLGAGLLVFLGGALLFRFHLLGGGDVKPSAATSLWLGLEMLPLHLLYVALLGGRLALLTIAVRTLIERLLFVLPLMRDRPLPHSVIPGEGMPYGVAIAGSALSLSEPVGSGPASD